MPVPIEYLSKEQAAMLNARIQVQRPPLCIKIRQNMHDSARTQMRSSADKTQSENQSFEPNQTKKGIKNLNFIEIRKEVFTQ